MTGLDDLLTLQSGVVTRRQLLELPLTAADVRRLLRRRELVAVSAGVYVNHTGELTWIQRAWAAVLAVWPAALCHQSALRAADGPGRTTVGGPIHVAVDRRRSPAAPVGVRLHQLSHLDDRVQWNLAPPRVRIENAVLQLAAECRDEVEAVALLADAVQARRTNADRLLAALGTHERIARREFLGAVLLDVAHGTCSTLEHGYLTRVERPHGLPAGERQVLASSRGPILRDVEYRRFGFIIELDGRLFHDNARSRDRDLDRDLDALVEGRSTGRLGWGQVFGRPCDTAHRVGRILQQGGWPGIVQPCPACASHLVQYAGVTG